jgi:hypothetical protein
LDLNNIEKSIDTYLHMIVDEIHPLFEAITDEEHIEEHADYGVFTRDFLHDDGTKFRMTWEVHYGTPETVRTIFRPAIRIE